jgi:hypothetical protein
MSVMTLRSLEAGGAGVTMGAYLSVMHVLGLEQDLNKVGAVDEMGRQLQDAQLTRASNPRTKKPVCEHSVIATESLTPNRSQESRSTKALKLNTSESLPFPLNTHSLSALLVRKKGAEPNT